MSSFANDDPAKRAAGYAAVDRFVVDGSCIGLGTGSTAYWAIRRVGERIAAGERITAVATSAQTEQLCRTLSIPLVDLLEQPMTVAIDGADEVAPDWSLTKGGGGALLREKLVARSCERYIVVVTAEKLVDALGRFPLPVEVVPFGARYVRREIERRFDLAANLRTAGGRPFVTDNGNWIFDCPFRRIVDPSGLDAALRGIDGVVAAGIFVDVASEVLVGEAADRVRALRRVSSQGCLP